MTLREKIAQQIKRHGPIPFSEYFALCLYDPEFGYYAKNSEQFGKSGDFYTSSDVHAVFGRLLARQFDEMWRVLGPPAQIEILELGPGRGLFARDVLDWSAKKFPEFHRALRYTLAEASPSLRARLQQSFAAEIASGKVAVSTLEQQSALSSGHPAIVFANEFFDATLFEVVSAEGELRVGLDDAGRFVESWMPARAELLTFLDRYSVHPEQGERVEVPLAANIIVEQIARAVSSGLLIAIDYGYTRDEQLAGRHRGTVMAYRQHSASPNPYEAPGEQDITAHVNFTALAAAAEQGGMRVQPLLTQSQFLMGIGEENQFADAFEDCSLPQERAKVALQLKHLVTPTGMGETFHVLVASKGIDPTLVARLSGLSFGRRSG